MSRHRARPAHARRGGRATRREREITELLRDGLRVATVAERLGLSQSTVRNHLSPCRWALQAELVELP
jgi:DNA-binding NarL/FixJ family response regulator